MPAEKIEETLEYPDWGKLFANKSEIRKAAFKNVAGVGTAHFWIYFIALTVSLILMVPYMLESESVLFTILMSIGASGIGAALLGYFNELALKQIERVRIIREYNDYVVTIYFHAYRIFACRSFAYMKQINPQNAQDILAHQNASKILDQLQILVPKIDSFIFQHCNLFDGDTMKFYQELSDQLVQFEGSLQNPIDITNLIDVMDGVRIWLRKQFALDNIKKQFLR